VDSISHIKGCNYFTVMSSPEFKKLMECDFDYIITPCCFDLEVKFADPSSVQVERYCLSSPMCSSHQILLPVQLQSVRFAWK
jgi:hypothetical protein